MSYLDLIMFGTGGVIGFRVATELRAIAKAKRRHAKEQWIKRAAVSHFPSYEVTDIKWTDDHSVVIDMRYKEER